ncbi:MAG: NYN domain-containing protein [Fimbriiglobus sp.]
MPSIGSPPKPVRVNCYIDGFNLYFGLKDSGLERYLWLDVFRLALQLLEPGQKLVRVNYFTSRISSPPEKRKRQSDYLEAIRTVSPVIIVEGQYLDKRMSCRSCGREWIDHEEKMTDVNIATELLADAFEDGFDTALVISADSDLVPPIRWIRTKFPQKRVVAVFPPSRRSLHLQNSATAFFPIGRAKLAASQLPDEIAKADGYVLRRPISWGPVEPTDGPLG